MKKIDKRATNQITYNNKTQSLTEWCKELNLNYSKIYSRIKKLNLTFKEAINFTRKKHNTRKKNNIISTESIKVNNNIIEGKFIKYTHNNLFKSNSGVLYMKNESEDFVLFIPIQEHEKKS